MLNEHDDDDTSKICPESLAFPEVAPDDFTAKMKNAKEAVAAVDANDGVGLDLKIVAGERLTILRAATPPGQWGKTLKDIKVSASSYSLYGRLYGSRDDVQPALAWAVETGHPSADRRRVPDVLKVIGDWKKAKQGDSAPAPAPEARQKPSQTQTIAELRQRLDHAEAKLVRMGDVLSLELEDDAHVSELVALAGDNVEAAIKEIAGLAQRYHRQLRDLVAIQTCNALHASEPAPEESADPRPGAAETDAGIDEAGGAPDHGDVQDFSRLDAAPSAALDNRATAAVVDERRPQSNTPLRLPDLKNPSTNNPQPPGSHGGTSYNKKLGDNANRVLPPLCSSVAGNEF
jgi:hypothetical protein